MSLLHPRIPYRLVVTHGEDELPCLVIVSGVLLKGFSERGFVVNGARRITLEGSQCAKHKCIAFSVTLYYLLYLYLVDRGL
jgi:hypothetical protein